MLQHALPCPACALCLQSLDARMVVAAESYSQQSLSMLDSQIAEVEDVLSYCNDVFATGAVTGDMRSLEQSVAPTPCARVCDYRSRICQAFAGCCIVEASGRTLPRGPSATGFNASNKQRQRWASKEKRRTSLLAVLCLCAPKRSLLQ